MNLNEEDRSQKRTLYFAASIAIGTLFSLLFAILVHPGLMGVGIAIGVTIGIVLSEQDASDRR